MIALRFLSMALCLTVGFSTSQLAKADDAKATQNTADAPVYELRIYHTNPGKIADLEARFRDHTVNLFKKHGMTNVAYFRPTDSTDERLIYLLEYPSAEARQASWKAFMGDPDWQAAYQASTVNGKLVKSVESMMMKATDFSPALSETTSQPEGSRVFELRDYTATEGNLANLQARFRDHTIALFERHGIDNVVYFQLLEGQPTANERLIYLVAHPSQEQAKASFGSFGKDPEWQSARKDSETRAGGSLTIKGGVKSTFLRPVDFSPLK